MAKTQKAQPKSRTKVRSSADEQPKSEACPHGDACGHKHMEVEKCKKYFDDMIAWIRSSDGAQECEIIERIVASDMREYDKALMAFRTGVMLEEQRNRDPLGGLLSMLADMPGVSKVSVKDITRSKRKKK